MRQRKSNAISDVIHKKSSVNAAVKQNNVPESTLRRYLKKRCKNDTEEQTSELKRYVIDIDRRDFGLTKVQLGNMCYN
ncbi:hypothetical protein J437_LFUL002659 [Ladona fulva]|uniref:HTH psq-type domain-containing protein n=1 Tax=Ladona fulva TaxID=123851 RepID=A0A8K0K1F3_LADFU|nr:hypothetical protein J437_LFUL002659 [Ladona fulva]